MNIRYYKIEICLIFYIKVIFVSDKNFDYKLIKNIFIILYFNKLVAIFRFLIKAEIIIYSIDCKRPSTIKIIFYSSSRYNQIKIVYLFNSNVFNYLLEVYFYFYFV